MTNAPPRFDFEPPLDPKSRFRKSRFRKNRFRKSLGVWASACKVQTRLPGRQVTRTP